MPHCLQRSHVEHAQTCSAKQGTDGCYLATCFPKRLDICARGPKRLPAAPRSSQSHLQAQLFGGWKKTATPHSCLQEQELYIFHHLSRVSSNRDVCLPRVSGCLAPFPGHRINMEEPHTVCDQLTHVQECRTVNRWL